MIGGVTTVSLGGIDLVRRVVDDAQLGPMMLRLIDDEPTGLLVRIVAVAAALGIGALHALGPGHGKVLVGAYLASSRGRPRDAVALGGLVAAMHTGAVLVLGIVFVSAQRSPVGERLEAALTVISGLAVTGVGVWLVYRQLMVRRRRTAARRPASAAARTPGHHTGDHGDRHQGGNGHDPAGRHHHELPAGVAPMSRAGVVALASSGGLVPSPAAFLVLATALATGRPGFGLTLVAAFSVGLAVTLAAVGLSVLWGRAALASAADRRPGLRWTIARLPYAGGAVVMVGGLLLALGGLVRF